MADIEFVSDSEVAFVKVAGSDLTVVQAAVVSTGLNAEEWSAERVNGLINRLMKDRHGAPFEHVTFTFMVKTPLFTARQMMRHRIASFNEASARYRILPAVFYVPPSHRPLVQNGKAMDYDFQVDEKLSAIAKVLIEQSSKSSYKTYEQLLDAGIAREVARMVLPANMMTEFMVTINLRSLFNIFSLRGENTGTYPSHPQFEIVQVASRMEEAAADAVPISYEAFVQQGRVQP